MSLFPSQRTAAPLTENEKNNDFKRSQILFRGEFLIKKLTLRKRVAEVLGVSESAVGRVIHKWNECKNGSFAEQKNIGRPLTMQKNIEKTISMYIYLMRKLMTNPFLKIIWNPVSKFLIKLISKCFR